MIGKLLKPFEKAKDMRLVKKLVRHLQENPRATVHQRQGSKNVKIRYQNKDKTWTSYRVAAEDYDEINP